MQDVLYMLVGGYVHRVPKPACSFAVVIRPAPDP